MKSSVLCTIMYDIKVQCRANVQKLAPQYNLLFIFSHCVCLSLSFSLSVCLSPPPQGACVPGAVGSGELPGGLREPPAPHGSTPHPPLQRPGRHPLGTHPPPPQTPAGPNTHTHTRTHTNTHTNTHEHTHTEHKWTKHTTGNNQIATINKMTRHVYS